MHLVFSLRTTGLLTMVVRKFFMGVDGWFLWIFFYSDTIVTVLRMEVVICLGSGVHGVLLSSWRWR